MLQTVQSKDLVFKQNKWNNLSPSPLELQSHLKKQNEITEKYHHKLELLKSPVVKPPTDLKKTPPTL